MKKTIISILFLLITLSAHSEEDKGTMVDLKPLQNKDTLRVTRYYGDWWFGLGVDVAFNKYFGDFYAAKRVDLAVNKQFNPEFQFQDGTGFGYSVGLLTEYNPISSPHGGFISVKYHNKSYNTESDIISKIDDRKYIIQSNLEFIEIRPAYRYDFGFLNLFGFIGPGVDIGIGQKSEHLLKFVNTGDIREHNKFSFSNIETRFYMHLGAGMDLFVTDLDGLRFRFSPFVSADYGTNLISTQNLGQEESSITFASVRLGVSLKMGGDHKSYDTLRFDPNFKGPDYEIATIKNGVNLSGNLKDTLIAPKDIAYFELPEPIEIVREEPAIFRDDNKQDDFKPVSLETNRMKFFEFTTSEATNLSSELKNYLDNVAQYMKENPKSEIRVIGHSDNSGTAEQNQRRSVIRKDRVVRYLLAKGINRYRILDRGEGDRRPIADTKTAEGRKKNRRVEITIIQ